MLEINLFHCPPECLVIVQGKSCADLICLNSARQPDVRIPPDAFSIGSWARCRPTSSMTLSVKTAFCQFTQRSTKVVIRTSSIFGSPSSTTWRGVSLREGGGVQTHGDVCRFNRSGALPIRIEGTRVKEMRSSRLIKSVSSVWMESTIRVFLFSSKVQFSNPTLPDYLAHIFLFEVQGGFFRFCHGFQVPLQGYFPNMSSFHWPLKFTWRWLGTSDLVRKKQPFRCLEISAPTGLCRRETMNHKTSCICRTSVFLELHNRRHIDR